MARRMPFIGGNWKMNTSQDEAISLATAVAAGIGSSSQEVEVVLFPPAPWLTAVADVLKGSAIGVGAQDVSSHQEGAWTGQISAGMLLDAGCSHTLVGHSERRHGLGESDTLLNDKVQAGLEAGLKVMLCIGETLAQREAGTTASVVESQLRAGLAGVSSEALAGLSIAYEPVWAIGTGRTAAPGDAQAVHEVIRHVIAELYDAPIAEAIRILYGGSMKSENASDLLSEPDIDGGLIGGASLHAEQFIPIVEAARATRTMD
ncbi:MAG: triose-phosphate isomerase [Phycisphaerales bacterium]|nr:triose-phosphate isomerase [Phycisphaerales bacterium]